MTAGERKVRAAVIEARGCPIGRCMTIGALGAQRTLVRIVFAMARGAIGGRVGKLIFGMAGLAIDVRMGARKRKFGRVVIEFYFCPAAFGVTGSAIGAQAAAMGIVLLVAANACDGRVAEFCSGDVTARAGKPHMISRQRIIREIVIERGSVEADNILVETCMFGVAGAAIG